MLVVLQARTASSRLPGKIFHTFYGDSILTRMLNIAKEISPLENIVLTTGSSQTDNRVAWIASQYGVNVVRGDEDDVLKRFYLASNNNPTDYVMRITCDNYLIQPRVLNAMHQNCIQENSDYCYVEPLSHFSGEIIRRELILDEYNASYSDMAKEHVTYDIRQRNDINILKLPDNFMGVNHKYRITLDDLADLLFMKALETDNLSFKEVDCLDALINLTSE